MTEDGSGKTHSRVPSSSSSILSGTSSTVPAITEVRYATNVGASPKKEPEGSPSHNNSNTTLLKERLKMAEKDILELQTENIRLKRLFIDSIAGPVNPQQSDPTNSTITVESFDNLADEIEVWRSKFLSSCVLVEQLTKENQDLKGSGTSAIDLFREIKNTASLTPILYEQINSWIHQYQQNRALANQDPFYSFNNDFDDENETHQVI